MSSFLYISGADPHQTSLWHFHRVEQEMLDSCGNPPKGYSVSYDRKSWTLTIKDDRGVVPPAEINMYEVCRWEFTPPDSPVLPVMRISFRWGERWVDLNFGVYDGALEFIGSYGLRRDQS